MDAQQSQKLNDIHDFVAQFDTSLWPGLQQELGKITQQVQDMHDSIANYDAKVTPGLLGQVAQIQAGLAAVKAKLGA